jgi:hypothetical protein
MSNDEFAQLARLLTRYCDRELDQWEFWSIEMSLGTAYIEITLKKPDVADGLIHSLTHWLEQHED